MTDTENTTGPSGEGGDLTVAELARRLDRTPEQVRNHADNLEAAIVGFQSYRTAGGSVLTRNAVKRITRTVKAAREIAALETDLNSIHGPAQELDRSPAPQGITVAGLARELDVSMDQAVGLVTDAGAPQPTDWYGTDVIAPEIADRARRLHRDTDPERPLFGVTPGVLARELGVVPEWLDGYVSSLLEEGRLVVWTDRGVLSAAAAEEIRALVRSEKIPASGPCSVPGQPREAAQATSPDPEDVAELLIRQDMALSAVDDGPERIPEDTAVLEWAVRTAGHRFDPHTLWDYDLLTDAEHVHRCLDHRHVGPNTRGPVHRG